MLFIAVVLLSISIITVIKLRANHPALVALCWLLGWLGQCFAPQLALFSVILAAISLAGQSSDWISALVALLTTVMFIWIHRKGGQTAIAIERVVEQALSRFDVDISRQTTAAKVFSDRLGRAGWRPFNFGRSAVKRSKNIAYGKASPGQLLDVYQPATKPESLMPVLIQVPGGAWVTGSKDEQGVPLLHHMAAQGWCCFAINYRLGPKERFPAMLEDVLSAIAWVKTHAHKYGGDADYIAITGGSAGGHLLSLAALLRDRERFQPGFEQVDTRVSVAVPFYGRYDFTNRHGFLPGTGLEPFLVDKVMPGTREQCPELWEFASPESMVHADAPPFFVVHGSNDSMIPVEEARSFVSALRTVSSQPVDYAELPGAEHAFDMVRSSWAVPTVNAVHRFLCAHHQHYLQQREKLPVKASAAS